MTREKKKEKPVMVELKYTAVSRQRVVASNGCAMIPWRTILDPDHGLHEYRAHVAGIDFYIWRAIGR
jgi:hypothetical protein